MQKTDVAVEANRTVGWSRRAIKLRHQIQFYNKIINKIEKQQEGRDNYTEEPLGPAVEEIIVLPKN